MIVVVSSPSSLKKEKTKLSKTRARPGPGIKSSFHLEDERFTPDEVFFYGVKRTQVMFDSCFDMPALFSKDAIFSWFSIQTIHVIRHIVDDTKVVVHNNHVATRTKSYLNTLDTGKRFEVQKI